MHLYQSHKLGKCALLKRFYCYYHYSPMIYWLLLRSREHNCIGMTVYRSASGTAFCYNINCFKISYSYMQKVLSLCGRPCTLAGEKWDIVLCNLNLIILNLILIRNPTSTFISVILRIHFYKVIPKAVLDLSIHWLKKLSKNIFLERVYYLYMNF